MPTLRQPRPTDAAAIKLREMDAMEVRASSGRTPEDALRNALQHRGKAWVVEHEGKPIAAFGVAHYDDYPWLGCPWLLASDELEKHPQFIARTSKRLLQEITEGLDLLINYVHQDNTKSIQWLEWLGFSMGERSVRGGEPFIEFTMEKDRV